MKKIVEITRKKGNISVFGVEWSHGVKWNKFNCSSSCYRDNFFLHSAIIEFPCINWFLFVLVRFTNGITRNCFYKYIEPSKNVCTYVCILCNLKFNKFSVCWFTTHRIAMFLVMKELAEFSGFLGIKLKTELEVKMINSF